MAILFGSDPEVFSVIDFEGKNLVSISNPSANARGNPIVPTRNIPITRNNTAFKQFQTSKLFI